MKIFKLIKSEFLKNYNLKRFIIIALVLLLSVIGLTEFTSLYYGEYYRDGSYYPIDYMKENLEKLSKKDKLTIEEEKDLYTYQVGLEIYQYLAGVVSNSSWQNEAALDLYGTLINNKTRELFKENRNSEDISYICKHYDEEYSSSFATQIYELCQYDDSQLDIMMENNKKKIATLIDLLQEKKYYLYLEYLQENGEVAESDKDIVNAIIDARVVDESDFRGMAYKQAMSFGHGSFESIVDTDLYHFEPSRQTYEKEKVYDFGSYEAYVNYYKQLKKDLIAKKAILEYSVRHNIKSDIPLSDSLSLNYKQINSKIVVNQFFHLSIVVLVIVSITSSGIISSEHSKGTIKNIITAPVKRWKILMSKFIYLILHTYIIWLMALFLISIYAGIRFGFNDLFTPKLIYSGGKVIEVNYYLYLLKNMFLASIPLIAFLSILFFLSTVTLNTTLTSSITSILGILPPVLYHLCANFGMVFNFLVKTPFLYFDSGFIFEKNDLFLRILKKTNINLNLGIVVSLIVIVIFYMISNIIYIKKDIKN